MKYLILVLFVTFTTSAFALNDMEFKESNIVLEKEFSLVDNETKLEIESNEKNDIIAFKCYYTMEWLYKECPFIERLEAVV